MTSRSQRRIDREINEYVIMKRRRSRMRAMQVPALAETAVDLAQRIAVPGVAEVILTDAAYSAIGPQGAIVAAGLWGFGTAIYRDLNGQFWPIGSSGGSGGLR